MPNIGGKPCPQESDIYMDSCTKCGRHVIAINDIRVYEACVCLRPVYKRGTSHKVKTARIVDALNLKYDAEEL